MLNINGACIFKNATVLRRTRFPMEDFRLQSCTLNTVLALVIGGLRFSGVTKTRWTLCQILNNFSPCSHHRKCWFRNLEQMLTLDRQSVAKLTP
jgi:hypothetical protein